MKLRLYKFLNFVLIVLAVSGLNSVAAVAMDQLPRDIWVEIAGFCSLENLVSVGGTSRNGRDTVQSLIGRPGYHLDLTDTDLTENQFRTAFHGDGVFHKARDLAFSNRSFKGDWINFLPTQNLQPRKDGTPRLKGKTAKGHFFEYRGSYSHLGHHWSDPSGLTWYSPPLDTSKKTLLMGYDAALRYCAQQDLRLPSIKEWRRLTEYMGARYYDAWGRLDFRYSDYYSQILFSSDEAREPFWSSSSSPLMPQAGFIFDLRTAAVYVAHLYGNEEDRPVYSVRCVGGKSAEIP